MPYTRNLIRKLRSTIGQNIHRLRAERKLTLSHLSSLTGVPALLLDHYELGKNEIKLDEVLKIACAMNVRFDELFASGGLPQKNSHR
jgi:transcriptional regulator with XRE-family HTH domain